MMSKRSLTSSAICLMVSAGFLSAQVITLESPAGWATLRNDSVVVKSQLDTGSIKGKSVVYTLSRFEKGKEKKLATKTLAITGLSQEFVFTGVKQLNPDFTVGGKDFVKVAWSIPKNAETGSAAPIGLVYEKKVNPGKETGLKKAESVCTAQNVDALLPVSSYVNAGTFSYTFLWNKSGLQIVIKKKTAKGTLTFAFDGKNGKNAFVSYADRFLTYSTSDDTLKTIFYNRTFAKDSITYAESGWTNEIGYERAGDSRIITIPWFDLGLKIFDGRVIGLAVVAVDEKGKQTFALPVKAQLLAPGTWGNLVMHEK